MEMFIAGHPGSVKEGKGREQGITAEEDLDVESAGAARPLRRFLP
jgi:hypothetical protein